MHICKYVNEIMGAVYLQFCCDHKTNLIHNEMYTSKHHSKHFKTYLRVNINDTFMSQNCNKIKAAMMTNDGVTFIEYIFIFYLD